MDQNPPTPYKYIWRDYSQPAYQSLILTLNSIQALSLLAFVSAFIAYVQTRWWIITRYLLISILRPVQLPDSDEATSLHHLSQAKAIKSLIFKGKRGDNGSMISISPWFGSTSLFNVLLFIVLGTIIPYSLSGGSGPAKVKSQTTDACDGFNSYSAEARELAQRFYEGCRAKASTNGATCVFKTPMVDSHPRLNLTVDNQCPFAEGNCENNTALRIEYLDMRPSEYGINADSRIRQSHSLTCAPVKVRWFQVPQGMRGLNATVFWVGYSTDQFNVSDTYSSIGTTIRYWPNTFIRQGPRKLESAVVYDLIVYPILKNYKPGYVYENFHPGLKSDDGDVFIVMFKFGVGVPGFTPFYAGWRDILLSEGQDDLYNSWGAITNVLGCFEQYQLCFDERCMEWSNATEATSKMFQFLQSNYDYDIASEVFKIQSLLIKATTIRTFMTYRHDLSMMARSMWYLSPQLKFISENSPFKQWHWEVQSWFEMAFLTVKFSILASVNGEKENSTWSYNPFSNTSWICDKLLFLDDDSTNINFIGLIATLSSLLVVYLASIMRRILVWIKHGLGICWKVCRWVGAALRSLWKDLLHDLALAYKWVQGAFDGAAEGAKAVSQAMYRGFGLFAGVVLLPSRRSSDYRPRNSDYDDDGMPSISASIGLESLPH
jgi:hypothetical protein